MLTIKILDAVENALDNLFTLVERTREGTMYEHRRPVTETKDDTFDKLKEILNPISLQQAFVKKEKSENVTPSFDFIVAEVTEDGDMDYNSMPGASHSEDTKEEDKIDRGIALRDVISKDKFFFLATKKDLTLLSSGGSNIKPGDILLVKQPIVMNMNTENEFNKVGYSNFYCCSSGEPPITCIKIDAENQGEGEGDQEQGEGDQEGEEPGDGAEMEIYSPSETDEEEEEYQRAERDEAKNHGKGEEVDISLEELQLEGTTETERDKELRRGKIIIKRVEREIMMDKLIKEGNFIGAEEEREEIEKLRAQQSVLEDTMNAKQAEGNKKKIIQRDEDRPKRKSQKERKMEEETKLRAFLSVDDDSNHGVEIENFGEEKGRGIKVI